MVRDATSLVRALSLIICTYYSPLLDNRDARYIRGETYMEELSRVDAVIVGLFKKQYASATILEGPKLHVG